MSTSLPTIPYNDRPDEPWPRILRFIGLVTLIYAAARVGTTISEARQLWPVKRVPFIAASGAIYIFWAIASVIQLIIGLTLIIGAIQLLRRGSQRLILLGLWAIILFWIVIFFVFTILRSGQEQFFFTSIFYGIQINLLPI